MTSSAIQTRRPKETANAVWAAPCFRPVGRRHLTAETVVRSQGSPRRICGGQVIMGALFPLTATLPPGPHNMLSGNCVTQLLFFSLWHCSPTRSMASSFMRFLDHTQRRTTVGRTPLDEGSTPRGDIYLITHNTHKDKHLFPQRDSNPQSQRPRTCTLDRPARGTGPWL